MVQNQNYANRTQGGNGRATNKPPSQPKTEIRVRTSHTVIKDDYLFNIRVTLLLGKQPITGQEVVLEEGTSMMDSGITDIGGSVVFGVKETCIDQEVIKNLYLTLTGTADEKMISLTVPAKKKAKKTVKKFKIKTTSVIDAKANECLLTFEVMLFEDDVVFPLQSIILKKGTVELDRGVSDVHGQITFSQVEKLFATERIITCRFCLENSVEEEEFNVTIPAATPEKKVDNEAEAIILRRYHDGRGNFSVLVRVLKNQGVGLGNAPVSIWYLGVKHRLTTDKNGETKFKVPGVVRPGVCNHLVATVSGVAEEATIDIKRRSFYRKVKAFTRRWWLRTNNGRAFILCSLVVLAWIITFIIGTGEPKINPKMFNNEDTGLSKSEQFYNRSAAMVDKAYIIKPDEPETWSTGRIAYWGWLLIISVLVLIYAILSLREEIAAGIEDGFEKLFDKSYSKAGDPAFEKLARLVGSYRVARKSPTTVEVKNSETGSTTGGTPIVGAKSEAGGHPTLGTLFKLDLLSDTLVSIIPAILKKIF